MNNTTKSSSALGGIGRYLWDIVAMVFLGASIAVAIHLTEEGASVLGMPQWAWYLPVFFGVGMYIIKKKAEKFGRGKEFEPFFMGCGLFLVMLVPALILIGFGVDSPEAIHQAGSTHLGISAAELLLNMGRGLAWISLAIVPAVAFIGCVGMFFEHAQKATRNLA